VPQPNTQAPAETEKPRANSGKRAHAK
jgi:hypothetical protein